MSSSFVYKQLFNFVLKHRPVENICYLLRPLYSPGSSLSVQDLASVCEGQDPLHLHVLCRQYWIDGFVSCSSEQDPGTYGSDDERILAGKLYNSSRPNTGPHCIATFIFKLNLRLIRKRAGLVISVLFKTDS